MVRGVPDWLPFSMGVLHLPPIAVWLSAGQLASALRSLLCRRRSPWACMPSVPARNRGDACYIDHTHAPSCQNIVVPPCRVEVDMFGWHGNHSCGGHLLALLLGTIADAANVLKKRGVVKLTSSTLSPTMACSWM